MRNLLCFARGHEGSWEALCVDYDIAVQGASFGQVQADLAAAIADYVEAAMGEDKATSAKLLARRAPLRVRLTWIARVLWSAWRRDADRDTSAWPAWRELWAVHPNYRRPWLHFPPARQGKPLHLSRRHRGRSSAHHSLGASAGRRHQARNARGHDPTVRPFQESLSIGFRCPARARLPCRQQTFRKFSGRPLPLSSPAPSRAEWPRSRWAESPCGRRRATGPRQGGRERGRCYCS